MEGKIRKCLSILFRFILVKKQCGKREMVSLPLAGVEQRFMSLSWNSLGSVSLGDLGHTLALVGFYCQQNSTSIRCVGKCYLVYSQYTLSEYGFEL